MLAVLASACAPQGRDGEPPPPAVRADAGETPSFADVAPVLHRSCTDCHRDGGSGPFPLSTWEHAAPAAERIAAAVESGRMPPWLPVDPPGTFVGERRLRPDEIALLRRWADAGAPRGTAPVPPPPEVEGGWGPGEPDLVVEFPRYAAPASGRDVYRNLVVEAPIRDGRWIRAAAVDPSDPAVVHHARMMVDTTDASRELDRAEAGPGFDGMDGLGVADDPPGFFVGWTPGKGAAGGRDDLAWRLEPGTDLVLQLHLRPAGREVPVRARVAFWFADGPPSREPVRLVLKSEEIDIPPGDTAWTVEVGYRLPVPVEVLGVYPHAHYLGKRLHGFASLPDGGRRWLVRIDDWDFDWQDEYRYRTPVRLPAGALLTMRYTYDNSASNPDNPHRPPRRVSFGPQSSDEMAELALQLLPESASDALALRKDVARWRYLEWSTRQAAAHRERGRALEEEGRLAEALVAYRQALLEGDDAEVMLAVASILLRQGEGEAAAYVATRAGAVGGGDPAVLGRLARFWAAAGRPDEAVAAAARGSELARARGLDALADSLSALRRRLEGG